MFYAGTISTLADGSPIYSSLVIGSRVFHRWWSAGSTAEIRWQFSLIVLELMPRLAGSDSFRRADHTKNRLAVTLSHMMRSRKPILVDIQTVPHEEKYASRMYELTGVPGSDGQPMVLLQWRWWSANSLIMMQPMIIEQQGLKAIGLWCCCPLPILVWSTKSYFLLQKYLGILFCEKIKMT